MKLYTRQGDDGRTSLFDGRRVPKCDPRVDAYGCVDELNAFLGLAAAGIPPQAPEPIRTLHERILAIQHELFSLGAELATPPDSARIERIAPVSTGQAERLESWIDQASAPVPPLKTFVLPGGDALAARLHVCRTVCRRAERAVVSLAAREPVRAEVLVYLNRLSDLFFAWARLSNHVAGIRDVAWENPRRRPEPEAGGRPLD